MIRFHSNVEIGLVTGFGVLALIASPRIVVGRGIEAVTSPNELILQARAHEAADALPETAFFQAHLHGNARPGTLMRSERNFDYDLPVGAIATRILYTSLSTAGHPTVASAVVVTPPGSPPGNGWPLLVWAHGTTGVARKCAPSLSKQLGYYVQPLVQQGFAVLAVDYSGLAAGGRSEYLSKTSNANDVVYAVPAAQAAVAHLTRHWVAIGHSQGGLVVWGIAEKMAAGNSTGYLGGVSIAGAVDMEPLIEYLANSKDDSFYLVYIAYGIKAQYAEFDVHAMLRPAAIKLYDGLTRNNCWEYGHAAFAGVKPGTVLQPNWKADPYVQKFLLGDVTGERSIGGPLLVIAGRQDVTVPPRFVEARVRALCRFGAVVDYQIYEGDHGSELTNSFMAQIQWIRSRFAGRPAPNTCK